MTTENLPPPFADNYIFEYYQKINDGSIIAGKWIKLAYRFIIEGLQNKEFFLDLKKANRAVRFIENFCHHSKGKLAPRLVQLELFQKAAISAIFGIVDATGHRQFREVLWMMGRKCGKSIIASGIAEYMAYADGEIGGEIYFIAPKMDQADIVASDFWASVQAEPDLKKLTVKRKNDYYIASTNTVIKKVAFSEKKSDGYNPSCVIADEIAAWPAASGRKQYEVMTSAIGAREQPLILSITTANYINDGPGDELFSRATRVLRGTAKEKRFLPLLYTIDDESKWSDINEIAKAMPNLGVSVSLDFMLNEIAKAEQSASAKAEFLCKYCCIKATASVAWLDGHVVEKAAGTPLRWEDYTNCYTIVGVDLSRTTDLSAVVAIVEKEGRLDIFSQFFMPKGKLEEAIQRDGIPYDIYAKQGYLTLSGDNFIDYHDVEQWIKELLRPHKIYPMKVMYDRYSAQYLIQDLENAGFQCDDCFQGENMTPAINEFEGLMKDGAVEIGDNPIMMAHLMNSAVKINAETERRKLVKIGRNEHIDGTAAILDAMIGRQKYWSVLGQRLRNAG